MSDDTIRSEFERLYSLPPDAEWDAEELVYESASCPDEAFIVTRMLDAFRTARSEGDSWRRQVDAEATVADSYRHERDDLRAALNNCRADLQSEKHRRLTCAAHCERLRGASKVVLDGYECAIGCLEYEDEAKESQAIADCLKDALNEIPAQSLAAVRAEAVKTAERYASTAFSGSGNEALNKVLGYADRIRRGEDE
jgi:hypothetical protein